jgi:DNA-binding NarL/FixJ family response regulator
MIVDDQRMVRMGLTLMVEAEVDMTVVGEAADGLEAVDEAARLLPDVVLMDVRMPGSDGITATRAIVAARSARAVIIVTTFDDEDYLLEGVRAGASGFLLKDAGADLLAAGIRAAHAGNTLIEPSMTRSLLERHFPGPSSAPSDADDAAPSAAATALLAELSPRERDVLVAVAEGASNLDIAKKLWVSEATVKTHLSNILAKTGSTSRVQAAVFAYESGFVRPQWLDGNVPGE